MRHQGVLIMPQTTRGRLMILFLGQLLFTASFSVDLTLTGIVGYQLTPDKTLATLPYSLITLVACLTTFGASILAAADNAPEATRARNIATVLSGGVIASILGPFLAYLGDASFPVFPMLEPISLLLPWHYSLPSSCLA